ncbi:hypothetical protein GCM10010129_74230 [Streptomyces fumigatiscleroticus]|nr:hypothetical protein GCM10010129_74230 [Streptomyces fumigatiscleroticus]
MWLELMRASAGHTRPPTGSDLVADRADALLLAALRVPRAPGTWREVVVRRHARALLDAVTGLPQDERPSGVQELRTALVNADVDADARR